MRGTASWQRMVDLVVAGCVIGYAVIAWHLRWTSDDGYINVRILEQLAAGNGPVFNAGERVEAGTSTLWLALVAVAHLFNPRPEITGTMAVVGCVLAVAGVSFALAGAYELYRPHEPRPADGGPPAGGGRLLVPAGLLVLLALPPVWEFATSGLETSLTFAWLGSCFYLLARRARPGEQRPTRPAAWRPLGLPVLIGLGPLVRPDVALFSVAFAAALLVQSRFKVVDWLLAAVAAGALPAGYEIFRMGYYASLVPNTALAKDASGAHWSAGWTYLRDYQGTYRLWIPVLLLLVGAGVAVLRSRRIPSDRDRFPVLAAPVLAGALHALYVVRLGGDFMHARFLLAATFAMLMPFVLVALPVPAREDSRASWLAAAASLACVLGIAGWAIQCASVYRTPYGPQVFEERISNEREYYTHYTLTGRTLHPGDWEGTRLHSMGALLDHAERNGERLYFPAPYIVPNRAVPSAQGYTVAAGELQIGLVAVRSGPHVLIADVMALTDPVTARTLPAAAGSRPGHLPRPEAWRAGRYAAPQPGEGPQVTAVREAMGCGELAELQAAVTEPMTASRFGRNLLAAPRLTVLRFPEDPQQARDLLCR